MASKLFNFIALSSFLILACSFSAAPTVHALSIDMSENYPRHLAHNAVFKKRANSRRCKPRPTSSLVSTSTHPTIHAPSSTNKSVQPVKPAAATPTPTSRVSSGGGGNGKAGISWANADDSTLHTFKTSKTSTLYNWSAFKPPNTEKAGFDFAAMCWGLAHKAEFMRLAVAGYAKYALGANEPNESSQANLSPTEAMLLWIEAMEPLRLLGYTLISPAPSSSSTGLNWLQEFINVCSHCTIDAIALHFYGTNPQDFIAYVKRAFAKFNKPIWVTEVGCMNYGGGTQCSQQQIYEFLTTIVDFMDNTDYVVKYFYFLPSFDAVPNYNMENNLMRSDGQPSDLGWTYITRNT